MWCELIDIAALNPGGCVVYGETVKVSAVCVVRSKRCRNAEATEGSVRALSKSRSEHCGRSTPRELTHHGVPLRVCQHSQGRRGRSQPRLSDGVAETVLPASQTLYLRRRPKWYLDIAFKDFLGKIQLLAHKLASQCYTAHKCSFYLNPIWYCSFQRKPCVPICMKKCWKLFLWPQTFDKAEWFGFTFHILNGHCRWLILLILRNTYTSR